VDADASAVIAGIGQGGQPVRGGAVERCEGVPAGSGDVVYRAGLGVRDPQREPAGAGDCLHVAAVGVRLAGIPHVDGLALDTGGLLFAAVDGDDRAVQDDVR
jgi:hypothetical protein